MKGPRSYWERPGTCLAALLAAGLLAGCGGQAPPEAEGKSPSAPASGPGTAAGREEAPFFNAAAAGEEGLAWTAPPAWRSEEPANPMRKAQYAVPAAAGDEEDGQCVVFYFGPGQGGPPRANAERWAGQFRDDSGGIPLPSIREDFAGTSKVMYVEVAGTYTPPPMMGGQPHPPRPGFLLLGAIVEGTDASWFFKCTGPERTMEANRRAFEEMIASVRIS